MMLKTWFQVPLVPLRACFLLGMLWLAAAPPRSAASQQPAPQPEQQEGRPNILVILCDDLGYGDLECYGHPHIKTPHLNRLAAEGIRFTSCYSAAPVCSPSRVGLLTGRSPNKAGVFDWIPPAGPRAKPDAREQVHMRSDEITIPHLLREAGYATCMAGKWHCNSRFNHPDQPQPGDFGFEHWMATQNNAAPSHENPRNFVRNGEDVGELEGFSCQLVADEAIAWLRDHRDRRKPFFLYVAFHEPHEPVASPPELVAEYEGSARTADEAQFFANVANVDRAVGRLLEALESLGQREQTLVLFTSDNGPETLDRYVRANRSYGRPGPLRGMKLHTHEAGFRVAGIAAWPARIQPGQVLDHAISSLDFLPTFCHLAGAEIPDDLELDGTDIVETLSEARPPRRSQPLIWAYYNALNEARVALRDGDWKILARLDGGQVPKLENITTETLPLVRDATLSDFELYDLSQDPGETTNLAESRSEMLQQLQTRLEREYRRLVKDSHVWTPQVAEDTPAGGTGERGGGTGKPDGGTGK